MKNIEKFFEKKIYVFLIFSLLSLIYFFDPLITGKLMFGTDYLAGNYFNRLWISEWMRKLYLPLWFPYERLGYGVLEVFWKDIFTPTGILRLFLPSHVQYNFGFFFYTLIAGFGTYLFLKELKLNSFSAFIGGVFYAFSGILITNTYAGHLNRLVSASLLPLTSFFLVLGIRKKSFLLFLIAGAVGGWQFLAGHFQMTYFAFLFYISLFFFYSFYLKNSYKTIIRLTLFVIPGIILTLMLYSAYLLPVLSNMKFLARGVERGYEYAASWALPIIESLDILFFNFSGFLDTYWGKNFFRLNHIYIGFIPIFLLIISFFNKEKKGIIYFFLTVLLISLTFSWGKEFITHKIFYYIIPGIKKFRAPSLMFFIACFSICVLSAFGIEYIRKTKNIKNIVISLLVFAGISLLLIIFNTLIKSILKELAEGTGKISAFNDNFPKFLNNLIVLFIESVFLFIIFNYAKRHKLRYNLILIFPLITFVEALIYLRSNFLKTLPLEKHTQKDEIIEFLEKKAKPFRVFYFPGTYIHENDGILGLYGIEDIGGYLGNPLQRIQELIGAGKSVMFNPQNIMKNKELLNILDAKYIILPVLPEDTLFLDLRTKRIVKFLKNFVSDMTLEYKGKKNSVYRNLKNMGRFFVVKELKIFDTKEEALEFTVKNKNFKRYVSIERKFIKGMELPTSNDSIDFKYSIIEEKPDYYKLKIVLSQNSILVFSMNYHPAWSLYIDGKKTKIFPVNHALIGAFVKKGEHTIEYKFGNKFHKTGILLTFVGIIISLIIVGISIYKYTFYPSRGVKTIK